MGTSIFLNDNAPTVSPTNGCCAGVADQGSPAKIQMSLTGSVGTLTTSAGSLTTGSSRTTLYYIGVPGQHDGLTYSAGTWTVPVHIGNSTVVATLDSIYICRCSSSGTSLGTIGSLTGIGQSLAKNTTYSYGITGSSVTFGTNEVPVISFQITVSSGLSLAFGDTQTITAPTSTSPGVSYSPSTAFVRSRSAPPTLANTSSGNVTYSPLTARLRVRPGAHSLVTGQTFAPPTGRVRIRGFAPTQGASGTVSYSPTTGLVRMRGSLVGATPLTAHIRFLRGPQSKMPSGWPEGAPFEGGIVLPSGVLVAGTVFTTLFLGGHDGFDKFIGPGLPTCNGQPTWTPGTDGSWAPAVLDVTNLKVWYYANSGWHYLLLT